MEHLAPYSERQFVFPFDVIIAHGPCQDGTTSAWLVWRRLPEFYKFLLRKIGGFYTNKYRFKKDYKLGKNNSYVSSHIHPNSPEGSIILQKLGYPVVFVFTKPKAAIPRELIEDKNVLILDLDLGDHLVQVIQNSNKTLLIDHHDSTVDTLATYSEILSSPSLEGKFETFVSTEKTESGASLAWCYFYNNKVLGAKIPPFIDIVRIGDNWTWKDNPHAKSIIRALYVRKAFNSFDDIEKAYNTWQNMEKAYIAQGQAILEYEINVIRNIAKKVQIGYMVVEHNNHNNQHFYKSRFYSPDNAIVKYKQDHSSPHETVYCIAYTSTSVLKSEVACSMRYYANENFKINVDFCAIWNYVPNTNLISISLREPSKGLNLSYIAKNVKNSSKLGGGHMEAAYCHSMVLKIYIK